MPETPEKLGRQIFDLKLSGLTVSEIATEIGLTAEEVRADAVWYFRNFMDPGVQYENAKI